MLIDFRRLLSRRFLRLAVRLNAFRPGLFRMCQRWIDREKEMRLLAKLLTVFRVPELRRKIILTVVLLAVYRLGFHITLPFMDHETVGQAVSNAASGKGGLGGLLQVVSVFSASDLQNGSVFGLGIMPYITASIVFQLLGDGLSASGATAERRRIRTAAIE